MSERDDEVTEAPDLSYRGLDLCDGCGARLESGDQLAGLCRDCERPISKWRVSKAGRKRDWAT